MSMKESILRFDSHLSFTASAQLLSLFYPLGNVEKYDCRSSSHTLQKIWRSRPHHTKSSFYLMNTIELSQGRTAVGGGPSLVVSN